MRKITFQKKYCRCEQNRKQKKAFPHAMTAKKSIDYLKNFKFFSVCIWIHAPNISKEMAQIKILLKYKTATEVVGHDLVSNYMERAHTCRGVLNWIKVLIIFCIKLSVNFSHASLQKRFESHCTEIWRIATDF